MDRLEKNTLQKELVFEEMVGMIDEVETQINEIMKRQNLMVDQRGEPFKGDQKGKLVSELKIIDELIIRSVQDIQTLNDKVRSSELRLGVFRKRSMVFRLI